MFTMCIANFTRVCAYWLFVFQYLKVAQLLPVLIDIQQSGSSTSLLNQKQTKQFLRNVNWGYILILGIFQFMQYQSDQFMATLLTYVPLAIQVSVLAYAMFSLKGHMFALLDTQPRNQAIFYPKDSFMNRLFGLALINFALSLSAQILT